MICIGKKLYRLQTKAMVVDAMITRVPSLRDKCRFSQLVNHRCLQTTSQSSFEYALVILRIKAEPLLRPIP